MAQSFVSWTLIALCSLLVWMSLTSGGEGRVGVIYACSASVLGVLAMLRNEFTLPTFMMLIIGALNVLILSSSPKVMIHSNVFALAIAVMAFALLLVGIWKPLRITKSSFPLPPSTKEPLTRAIAATSLSFFVPLVFLVVLMMWNREAVSQNIIVPMLAWNGYMYALFYTAVSYGLAALILIWRPSLLNGKNLYQPQLLLIFGLTILGSVCSESLFRKDWSLFIFSQIGVLGIFTMTCHIRTQQAFSPKATIEAD